MLLRIALISSLIAVIAACDHKAPVAEAAQTAMPAAAVIAIFEEFVPKNELAGEQIHCLEVDGQSPEAAVISHMTTAGYRIAPISECTFDIKRQGFHTKTRRPAVFHYIRDFTRFGDSSAEANVGTIIHGLDDMHYRVDLQLSRGKWYVRGREATGVS